MPYRVAYHRLIRGKGSRTSFRWPMTLCATKVAWRSTDDYTDDPMFSHRCITLARLCTAGRLWIGGASALSGAGVPSLLLPFRLRPWVGSPVALNRETPDPS